MSQLCVIGSHMERVLIGGLLGILIFEMINGLPPFYDIKQEIDVSSNINCTRTKNGLYDT